MKKIAVALHGTVGDLIPKHQKHLLSKEGEEFDNTYGSDYCLDIGRKAYELLEKENEGIEFDYYIHSWSTHLGGKLGVEYTPRALKVEEQADFRKDFTEGYDKGTPLRYHLTKSRWYSAKESLNLIEDQDYDYVMLSRFDIMFNKPINFASLPKNKSIVSNWIDEAGNNIETTNRILDYWIILTWQDYLKIKNRLNREFNTNDELSLFMNKHQTSIGPSSHIILRRMFIEEEIEVEGIGYYKMESWPDNDHNLVRDDFYQNKRYLQRFFKTLARSGAFPPLPDEVATREFDE